MMSEYYQNHLQTNFKWADFLGNSALVEMEWD